jgi:hypothetical protein
MFVDKKQDPQETTREVDPNILQGRFVASMEQFGIAMLCIMGFLLISERNTVFDYLDPYVLSSPFWLR